MITRELEIDSNKLKMHISNAVRDIIFGSDKNTKSKPELMKVLKLMAAPNDISSLRSMYLNDIEYFDNAFNATIDNTRTDIVKIYKSIDAYKPLFDEISSFASVANNAVDTLLSEFRDDRQREEVVVFMPDSIFANKFNERKYIPAEHIISRRGLERFLFEYLDNSYFESKISLKISIFDKYTEDKQISLFINGSKFTAAVNPQVVIYRLLDEIENNLQMWYNGKVSEENGFGYASTALYNNMAKHGYMCIESMSLMYNIIKSSFVKVANSDERLYSKIVDIVSEELGDMYHHMLKAVGADVFGDNVVNKEDVLNELSNKLTAYSEDNNGALLLSSDKFMRKFSEVTDSYRAYLYALNSYVTGIINILNGTIKHLAVEMPKLVYANIYNA